MSHGQQPFTLEEAKMSIRDDLDNWNCYNKGEGKVAVNVNALMMILDLLEKYEKYILENL